MATSTTDEWKDVPQTLYHYCNAEGLKGIVENKCLWMSNVACMNDYMEHNWLLELARECLRLRMRRSVLNLLDSPDQFYEELETLVFSQPTSTPYVVSFSAGGDILSQWRAYSDDGLGFAVGFDPRLFGVPPCIPRTPYCTLPHHHPSNIGLSQVFYKKEMQVSYLDKQITECHDNTASPTSERARQCYDFILRAALVSKNPAFQEEGEWRIIWLPKGDPVPTEGGAELQGPKFRVRGGRVIPYYELRCNRMPKEIMPIKEVVLGPKNPHRGDWQDIARLLVSHGHDVSGIEFVQSQASYR
jgi:hypothetical protein